MMRLNELIGLSVGVSDQVAQGAAQGGEMRRKYCLVNHGAHQLDINKSEFL
jgi:hypothetical protein